MSGWLKSVFKSVLNTGLKLAEIILKPIINNFFDLKEIKEIVKDYEIDEIEKSIYGLKDNFKPCKCTSSFNSNYVEYRGDGHEDKNLSIKEYLDEMRPYFSDIINEPKNKNKWKIQVNMSINFISLKDSNEVRTMYTKSDNVDIMTGVDTNDVVEELFKKVSNWTTRINEGKRICV